MEERILVVGGAGYVGSVLIRFLLDEGYKVKVFDRLFFGNSGIIEVADKIELEIGDLRTINPSVLDDIDCVINIAGLSNDPTAEYNPEANYEINTFAAVKLAKACKHKGIKRFIFASSCSVYHVSSENEIKDLIYTEDDSLNPTSSYSRSKFNAETEILSLHDDNFCPVILRKGTIYGISPRMRYDLVVNTFVKCALQTGRIKLCNGGAMWRPLIDIKDVAQAYIKCIQADEKLVKGQIFNIAYHNYRISELALAIQDVLSKLDIDVNIEMEPHGSLIRSYRVSTQKAKELLKFSPQYSVEESVLDIMKHLEKGQFRDFDNPKYYNINWMQLLEEANSIIRITGTIFETPPAAIDRELINNIQTNPDNGSGIDL